ncbi:DUF7134 domain-containing protein [Streptomyces sp. A5-4]|uniref:DUF7134 domain-containing protein n=1 Tax=Streptomyces sp. A5-4 TaxID=3384771 RepID=UPI003DA846D7
MRIHERGERLRGAGPRVVDIGITVLVQAAVTMPFVVPRAAGLPEVTWASYGLTTLAVLPLIWRRRAPVAVLLSALTISALYKLTLDGPGQPLPYPGLIAVYTVAALSPPRKRVAVTVLTFATIVPSVTPSRRPAGTR